MFDRIRICFLFVALLLGMNGLWAQPLFNLREAKGDTSWIEIGGMAATNSSWSPFWIQANQWGTYPKYGNGGTLRLGYEVIKPIGSDKSNWAFTGGVEAVENITDKAKFILPQAYAGLRFKNWELRVGRRKQVFGLGDTTLTSGFYAMSGNALPVPKIEFGTVKFIPVPFTNKWLNFMATYSDGLLENSREFTRDLKLHQKQLYLRVGRENSKLKLYGGGNHSVQWGGYSPFFTDASNRMSSGFAAYLAVISATAYSSASRDTFDLENRIGNHLGSVDFAAELETYGATFFLYRQFFYEDGSLFKLVSVQDGLTGLSIKRKTSYGANFEVNRALVEFLYTMNQGGDEWDISDGRKLGRDNYFNHAQVMDGWSYFRRTVGTPFIPPRQDIEEKQGVWGGYTTNNRLWAAHIGLEGTLFQKIHWATKFSYSRNFGIYDRPFEKTANQISGFLSLYTNTNWLGGMTFKVVLAGDKGDLYPDSYGARVSLIKTNLF